ncbi:MAG TPA: alpha/beta hydrolase [Candidatus Binatia bacterium]|nr:alpha/beta hydrolase [Candidatus Binatia bacterium]
MTSAPQWFRDAVAQLPRHSTVQVEGCPIHCLSWGDTGKPGLLLIHGGAAHAHWWSFLAPLLASDYHVVAFDLSGHGDSGRRQLYPREIWALEAMAVCRHAGLDRHGPPIIIGHSLGGFVTMVAASLYGDRMAGAVIVDSPVTKPDPESQEGRQGRAFRNPKVYPSIEEAVTHFHLIPAQPCDNDYIVDHVARHSLKKTDDGWTWKFDPVVFERVSLKPMSDYLADTRCRVAILRGELSNLVPPETGQYMYELLDRNAPIIEIPQAHHHLILDQPLAFVAAARALLADWEHSLPRKRGPAAAS